MHSSSIVHSVLSASLLIFSLSLSPSVQANEAAKRGKAVINEWCAKCHITGARKQKKALDAAPTFPEIANAPKMTEVRLRAILASPHSKMPTGALSTREIDDVIVYILSLRK